MTNKTYLIIGSNCFTGSHIVAALLDNPNNRVIGTSRSPEYKPFYLPYSHHNNQPANFRFYQLDAVRDFGGLVGLLNDSKPDVVINVAALSEVALSNERPVEYFDLNTLAVVKLCNYLRTCDWLERYVHISSAEIFGTCDKPAREESLFNPSTPYAVSKAAADMYLDTLIKNFQFPATIIRSTNVYGKHQQLYKIIPRTAIYLKLGRKIELHGGGRSIKSFIHIRDVVKGVLLALAKGSAAAYHFTIPATRTVADIVRQICSQMGYEFERTTRIVDERLGQDARYWLDCSKAARELEWAPEIAFEDGVRETIAWIEEHWKDIVTQPLLYVHKV